MVSQSLTPGDSKAMNGAFPSEDVQASRFAEPRATIPLNGDVRWMAIDGLTAMSVSPVERFSRSIHLDSATKGVSE